MNAMRCPKLLLALCWLGASAAWAEADAPINIEANQADVQRDSSVYNGNVRITQGSVTLSGDRLTVTRLPRKGPGTEDQFELVLTGQPAKVTQEPPQNGGEPINAQAARVQYLSSSALLELRGNAVLYRGGEKIAGETIQYDWRARRTRVNTGGGGRVSITLQPGSKDKE